MQGCQDAGTIPQDQQKFGEEITGVRKVGFCNFRLNGVLESRLLPRSYHGSSYLLLSRKGSVKFNLIIEVLPISDDHKVKAVFFIIEERLPSEEPSMPFMPLGAKISTTSRYRRLFPSISSQTAQPCGSNVTTSAGWIMQLMVNGGVLRAVGSFVPSLVFNKRKTA